MPPISLERPALDGCPRRCRCHLAGEWDQIASPFVQLPIEGSRDVYTQSVSQIVARLGYAGVGSPSLEAGHTVSRSSE
ncbi:hypothetical protein CBM2598_U10079 [Cupriavidus taiwanensis]|uniref:Uncharacterized protein n=1 Tax=Cupriavidus taiwanensis TaxID=164546 RepID=A0A7Z7JFT2_9BURK|nr:hypothetical protein CBM2597_U10271 [Cupriavidus taiwanensis]SOZ96258.1 hypothetical protein CBM2598_U10079 [Cupriavidus taiwanensis]SPC25776.1 hypothetical protein CBM2594_U10277 [Cupriavidus taiwanensis]